MLTIFALPKPFQGHIGNIQRNAVRSWKALKTECQVILFGDEAGTAEAAKELDVQHVPDVAVNEFGTPLLNDLFDKAGRLAENDLLCYVNCDIILMDDFLDAASTIKATENRFLMIGECWNLDVENREVFASKDWKADLKKMIKQSGESRGPWFIDYFVFPRDFYKGAPPFALGRAGFDNWLIWRARNSGTTVIDASQVVMAIHQDHNYSHVVGGRDYTYAGQEAQLNMELAGGLKHYFMAFDATHYLSPSGIQRNFGSILRTKYRIEYIKEWSKNAGWRLPWWLVMELTRPIRSLLGLDAAGFQKLKKKIPLFNTITVNGKGNAPSSNRKQEKYRWNKSGRSRDMVWAD